MKAGFGSLGVWIVVGSSLAACDEQELEFKADRGQGTHAGSTTGPATNTGGSSSDGGDAAAGPTGATTAASSGAGGSGGSDSGGAGGDSGNPKCDLPAGRRLFAGYFASCALDDEGTPRCFGQDGWETPTTTAPVVDIAINQEGACALQNDCALKCWGSAQMLAKSPPSGAFTAIATAEGGTFCALDLEHRVECWGPQGVASDPPDVELFSIAGGELGQFCGLDEVKDAVCWGDRPGEVRTSGPFSLLAPADHVCGLDVEGSLSCWGNDYYGATSPPEGTFKSLVSTHVHSCALAEDGEASCWGALYYEEESPDLLLPPDEAFTTIVTGLGHMCGLTATGTAACWGYGTPERDNGVIPDLGQASPPEGPFVEIGAGYWHTCGLSMGGAVTCWGAISGTGF